MKTLQLKYFRAILNKDDVVDKETGWPLPLNPVFNGLTRFCKDNGYGTNFSMDEKNGFKIHDLDTIFRIHDINISGQRYSTGLSAAYIKWSIEKGDTVIITMLESIPPIN